MQLLAGQKVLPCKWVYRLKITPEDAKSKYKARLVAKGFIQKEGIDYFDTYSRVTRIITIHTLIVLASIYNLIIHQMDVKTAFLNGDLEEEICMDQLEGYVAKGQKKKVCMLVKSLYGLKQAHRAWYERLSKFLIENEFTHENVDTTLFLKKKNENLLVV